MYANEAKGERFPPNKYANDDLPGDCNDPGFDFFFQGRVVHPEYLSDAHVIMCPSDANAQDDFVAGKWNCGHDTTRPFCPCQFDSRSYVYLSWATKPELLIAEGQDVNDPNPGYHLVTGGFIMMYDDLDQEEATVGEQSAKIDKDFVFADYLPGAEGFLYRLREGIERFFITDINNPTASSEAQSTIPVMLDEVSTDIHEFNHIPGGGNVLFMDGHVEFIRYPGKWPVTTFMAWVTGL